jgi:Abnormal spindle-like microcephaly-assoc'd, ASPM-SPD-2-Hydin
LLGPGDPGAPPAGITVRPAPILFGNVPVGTVSAETVTVTNSGTGDLEIYPSSLRSRGTTVYDENGVFSIVANAVEGATIAPGANATLKVEFRPETAGTYTGTLTISSNAGTNPIDLFGEATAKQQQAAGRGLLRWARRRRGERADQGRT